MRSFLWKGGKEKQRIHLLNWDTICRPKIEGGLGIKRLGDMDLALRAKKAWILGIGALALWKDIQLNKYRGGISKISFLQHANPYRQGLVLWRNIIQGLPLIQKYLVWNLGDGRSIQFFDEAFQVPTSLVEEVELGSLRDWFLRMGQWRMRDFVRRQPLESPGGLM